MKDYQKNYERFLHYLFRDTDSVEQACFELVAAYMVCDGCEQDDEASYWQNQALEAWDHKWSGRRYYKFIIDSWLN